MPMPSLGRLGDLDARAWSTATWSAPFIVQLVLAALVVIMWLLSKWPFATYLAHGRELAWPLTATVITTLVSLAISGVLLGSPSSRRRGLSLSIGGSSAVVLVGGVIWAFCVYR